MQYKMPFSDLLPPLTTEEFEALAASIELEGIRDAVVIDEDGNVLDGHNRLLIRPDAPTRLIAGLTQAEKQAYVFQANLARRNLSPEQKREARARMQRIADRLQRENPAKNTQQVIAARLGVARQTVSDWLTAKGITSPAVTSNAGPGITCNPPPAPVTPRVDPRVKVPAQARPIILQRVESGESQAQVAADYAVSQQTISSIVTREAAQKTVAKLRRDTVSSIGELGIHCGDFREASACIPDASVDLIFTDPPYDEASVSLYGDLARIAARILRPGGWCLAYSGHSHLPHAMALLAEHLEYGWMFAIQHVGGDLRFRNLKIQNHWKPILGFYRPPLTVWWDWFGDTAAGGKEKSEHAWQQAESEAAHFIQALSPSGGLVCDPFVGSGTTCAAAKKLGRQWIGFDVDQTAVEKARMRMHDGASA